MKLTLWTAGAENQVIPEAHKQQDQEVSSISRLQRLASRAEVTPYDSEDKLNDLSFSVQGTDVIERPKRLRKSHLSWEGQS